MGEGNLQEVCHKDALISPSGKILVSPLSTRSLDRPRTKTQQQILFTERCNRKIIMRIFLGRVAPGGRTKSEQQLCLTFSNHFHENF